MADYPCGVYYCTALNIKSTYIRLGEEWQAVTIGQNVLDTYAGKPLS